MRAVGARGTWMWVLALGVVIWCGGLGGVAAASASERPQIVGGHGATSGQFPELAFVVYHEPDGTTNFTCTGTVISPKLVLTAGHCAIDTDTGIHAASGGYLVVTGTNDWASPVGRSISPVSRVFVAPGFNKKTLSFDSSILELSTPTAAAPVPLAGSDDAGLYASGTSAEIAGWGQENPRQENPPSQLQWAGEVVQGAAFCGQAASSGRGGVAFNGAIQTCAEDVPSDASGTCHGDSGGPLLAQTGGSWIEIGVTSFGASQCSTHIPSFFTRADAISSWADSLIAQTQALGVTAPGAEPRHPRGGTYRAKTSQKRSVRLHVARSGRFVTSMKLSFVLKCSAHRKLRITATAPRIHWSLKAFHGFGFKRKFRDSRGIHYRMEAKFLTTGETIGLFHATEGGCKSGSVDWEGKL